MSKVDWSDLDEADRRKFTAMLNKRFNTSLSVAEASEYYGNPEKVKNELGDFQSDRPECPECFTPLYKEDIPHIKQTGECPNCGATLVVK